MTGQTDVLWFLPTHGDGRYLGSTEGARESSLPYLKQIAQAADQLGYFGVLLPTGRSCEDSWIIASALAPATAAPALPGRRAPRPAGARRRGPHGRDPRPGLERPPPHQRRHRRRPGGAEGRWRLPRPWRALRGHGRVPAHLARPPGRRDRDVPGPASADRGRQAVFPAVQRPYPPLFFGGSSDAGMAVAADHVDVYLTWGEPPADVAEKLAAARKAAAARGRTSALRHPPPRHRPRKGGGRLARRRRPDLAARRRTRSPRPSGPSRVRLRRPEPDGAPAWRSAGQARRRTEPLGRHRARPRRRRHRACRRSRPGRGAHARVHRPPASTASSSPAIRTSRKAYRFAELVFPKLPLKATTGTESGRKPTTAAPSARSSPTTIVPEAAGRRRLKSSSPSIGLNSMSILSPSAIPSRRSPTPRADSGVKSRPRPSRACSLHRPVRGRRPRGREDRPSRLSEVRHPVLLKGKGLLEPKLPPRSATRSRGPNSRPGPQLL